MDEVVHHHGNILLIFMCFKLWFFRVLVLFIRLAGKLFSALSFVLVLELHQVSTVCQKKRGHLKTLSVLQGPLSLSFFGRLQMYTAEGTHVRSVKQVVLAHRYKRSGKMHMGDQCSCVFFLF